MVGCVKIKLEKETTSNMLSFFIVAKLSQNE
jgi:hypothetical protein